MAAALRNQLWVCLSLQNVVTIVLLPPLATMAKKRTDLQATAQTACSLCTELEGTKTNLAGAWRVGPSPVLSSHGLLPHTSLQGHRHRAGEQMCVPTEMGPTGWALATNSQ